MMQYDKGFSLAEIVVVVAIISLLGTISVTTYVSYRDQANVAGVEAAVLQLLETAKHNARTGFNDTSWSIKLEADQVILFAGSDFATRDESFDRVVELSPSVTLTGPDTLTFTAVTGYPDAAVSYTLLSPGEDKDITINAYGTIATQ